MSWFIIQHQLIDYEYEGHINWLLTEIPSNNLLIIYWNIDLLIKY